MINFSAFIYRKRKFYMLSNFENYSEDEISNIIETYLEKSGNPKELLNYDHLSITETTILQELLSNSMISYELFSKLTIHSINLICEEDTFNFDFIKSIQFWETLILRIKEFNYCEYELEKISQLFHNDNLFLKSNKYNILETLKEEHRDDLKIYIFLLKAQLDTLNIDKKERNNLISRFLDEKIKKRQKITEDDLDFMIDYVKDYDKEIFKKIVYLVKAKKLAFKSFEPRHFLFIKIFSEKYLNQNFATRFLKDSTEEILKEYNNFVFHAREIHKLEKKYDKLIRETSKLNMMDLKNINPSEVYKFDSVSKELTEIRKEVNTYKQNDYLKNLIYSI